MEDDEPAYAFYDQGAADTLLTPEEMPAALFEETAILHFGSISLLRGTTPDAVVSTAERLKGKALLSFDPNVRPSLVRDETAYRALLDRLFFLADLVKISSADLAWLLPDCSLQEAIAHLAAYGPALVVVTKGSRGVLARRGSEEWNVPASAIEMVDTVGAGDSFSAGLLAGLMDRGVTSSTALEQIAPQEIEAALRFAAAASAITCTRPGADPPSRMEVDALLRKT
jgi:fructokinase